MNLRILRRIIKNYFTFTRSERYGVISLCFVLLVMMVINFAVDFSSEEPPIDFSEYKKAMNEWGAENATKAPASFQTLFYFNPNTISKEKLDSLAFPQFIKSNLIKYRERGGVFYNKESVRKLYGMNDSLYFLLEDFLLFEKTERKKKAKMESTSENFKPKYRLFDPNTVTKEELLCIGFNEFQASNLIKYRESGAFFHQKNDLLKIYGIDSSFLQSIKPIIKIDTALIVQNSRRSSNDSILIEINQADSASLVRLNGIGPVLAARIIKYRKLLGGFAKKEQIAEVYGISMETYAKIKNNIQVDTFYIQKLSLNFSDYNQLVRHPYLVPGQVEKILEIRNKSGPFVTCKDLISKNILSNEEFEKVRQYLKINVTE